MKINDVCQPVTQGGCDVYVRLEPPDFGSRHPTIRIRVSNYGLHAGRGKAFVNLDAGEAMVLAEALTNAATSARKYARGHSPDGGNMVADRSVDRSKMEKEPAGNLEKLAAATIYEGIDIKPVLREGGGFDVEWGNLGETARAVIALFQPQFDAAEGLLRNVDAILGCQFDAPAITRSKLAYAVKMARAAGMVVSHPPFQPGGDALRHWNSEWDKRLRDGEAP